MNNLFSLSGKVAVVTGGSGLLGEEFCTALSNSGATVVVADIDIAKCTDVAARLANDSFALRTDVTDVSSLIQAKQHIYAKCGRLDVLINNAAINDMIENSSDDIELSRVENYPLALWNRVMNVNVTGVFLASQIFGSAMAEQGRGSIINIASTYGVVAPDQSIYHDGERQRFFKSPVYPTSKAAVLGLTRHLASYWARQNVRVNALSPGGVQHEQDQYFIDNYEARVPMGRMSQPNDYAGAAIFLASDASSYMTGANLIVDGGWTSI